jgi:hypothetical protein
MNIELQKKNSYLLTLRKQFEQARRGADYYFYQQTAPWSALNLLRCALACV